MDRIYHLIRILERPGVVHHLEKDIMGILLHTGIIKSSHAHVDMKLWFAHRPECFFSAKIHSNDNMLAKDISIVVKPDHNDYDRVMRVVVQVESKVIDKSSDEDHFYESDNIVFNHEMRVLEHFLKNVMYRSRRNIMRGREAF